MDVVRQWKELEGIPVFFYQDVGLGATAGQDEGGGHRGIFIF